MAMESRGVTGIGSGAVLTVVRVGQGNGKMETFTGNITTLHGGVETDPETGERGSSSPTRFRPRP